MTTNYVHVVDDTIINKLTFDDTGMPPGWPDAEQWMLADDDAMVVGATLVDGEWVPPPNREVQVDALKRLVKQTVIVDRLSALGFLEAARAALDGEDLYTQERWNARTAVFYDDPKTIELLNAIGADPDVILAPGDEIVVPVDDPPPLPKPPDDKVLLDAMLDDFANSIDGDATRPERVRQAATRRRAAIGDRDR